jgi:hypothetical protein
VECHVDPGGHPGGGDDLAIVDKALIASWLDVLSEGSRSSSKAVE